jgi:hypothetical protein
MRWQATEEVKVTTETSGVVTALPVSHEWAHFGDPTMVRVEVVVSAATHVGTQTLILQQYSGGAWVTLQSAAFTAASTQVFLINSDTSFKAVIPVSGRMRVVLTQDNAGDKATISSIKPHQFY